MYTAINGIFENGRVILKEPPPTTGKARVVVMFLPDEKASVEPPRPGVKLGSLAGKGYAIPGDFNDPLEDLAEYQ